MYTAKRVFQLQASRFALVLQLFIFVLILGLLYQSLTLGVWLVSLLIMIIAWFRLFKQPRIQQFEYLDDQDWSFSFQANHPFIQRRKISKIIDHQCYIVIYFLDIQHQPCIIWWDQLPLSQWKNLKSWVKLA